MSTPRRREFLAGGAECVKAGALSWNKKAMESGSGGSQTPPKASVWSETDKDL